MGWGRQHPPRTMLSAHHRAAMCLTSLVPEAAFHTGPGPALSADTLGAFTLCHTHHPQEREMWGRLRPCH